jgi:hypothetical protein
MLDKKEVIHYQDYPDLSEYASDTIYKITLHKVIEERCDELDYEIEDNGYEIIHRDMTRVATSIYNYDVFFIKA